MMGPGATSRKFTKVLGELIVNKNLKDLSKEQSHFSIIDDRGLFFFERKEKKRKNYTYNQTNTNEWFFCENIK